MARNPVIPVLPVDPVGPVRRVEQGSIYFRHLDEWRAYSQIYAKERRLREQRAKQAKFPQMLVKREKPDKPE